MSADDQEFLIKELFRRLCNELRELIDHSSGETDGPSDLVALQQYAFEYSKQKFAEQFNFEFEGSHSKPPNSKPGGKVLGYQGLLSLPYFPAKKDVVEHWMDAVLFR